MKSVSRTSSLLRASRCLAMGGIAMAGLSIGLSACGERVYISKESLSDIKSIEIDSDVSIPDEPVVHGEVDIGKNLFQGLLTGASPMPSNVGRPFAGYMNKYGIEMDRIVLRTFRRYLDDQGSFELREGGDATLELAVLSYGFMMPAFDITKNMRNPEIQMKATLWSKDSKVLWRKSAAVMRSDLTHPYNIRDLSLRPGLVEKSLEEVSCVAAHLLLSDFDPVQSSADESAKVPLRFPDCDPVFPRESKIECTPGAGCVYHDDKSTEIRPSPTPSRGKIKCTPEVGCTYE